MKKIVIFCLVSAAASLFTACGKKNDPSLPVGAAEEAECHENCNEADLNAPVDGSVVPPENEDAAEEVVQSPVKPGQQQMRMPAFKASWGIPRDLYDKTARYHDQNYRNLRNPRFVTIIDFNQHSSKKRFYLFDLERGVIERHNTAHGKNSDRNKDGYADSFSNTPGTAKSSLGIYVTASTYTGKNGRSLRLRGKEASNSNAYSRAIVVHSAKYVSDRQAKAGRSWGCPALDPGIAQAVITKIKDGSVMMIGK
jgi:hypothetical protein